MRTDGSTAPARILILLAATMLGAVFGATALGPANASAAVRPAATAPNGYPYCANGAASDPDGDGWGWENDASCVVHGGRADTGPSGGIAVNGYPYCANGADSDPDGDGWGWENDASCVVRGSKADPGSGPIGCPSGATCGSYRISGLGTRKQQVLHAGGDTLDLAIGMLETDTLQANYQYGDGKTGDAANFGIFKQNWLMIRSSCGQFAGEGADRYGDGAALNSNLGQDLACLHQSQNHYPLATWFAGHRDGSSGLGNPNTADITAYRSAVYWILGQLDSNTANLSNDTRFWVQVPAI